MLQTVFIVIFSSFIVFSDKKTPEQIQNLSKGTEELENNISLNTVGDFEKFCNVIKVDMYQIKMKNGRYKIL